MADAIQADWEERTRTAAEELLAETRGTLERGEGTAAEDLLAETQRLATARSRTLPK